MIAGIAKALSRTGAGRAVGGAKSLFSKAGIVEAFSQTGAGKLLGGGSSGKSGKKARTIGGEDKTHAAQTGKASAGGDAGLQITKQTLEVLHSIDDNLKRIVDALGLQKQKDAAAAEEAASEGDAVPAAGNQSAQPEEQGWFRKFMKVILGLALSITQIAMPLYKMISGALRWIWDLGGEVLTFLKEKVLKIFTEDLPKFFVEDVPDFFMNTLPDMFNSGVDFVKGKMAGMLGSLGNIVGNIKSKIGALIVDLADSSVAKFLLPDSLRSSIKEFGQGLQKQGVTSGPAKESPQKTPAGPAAPVSSTDKVPGAPAGQNQKLSAKKELAATPTQVPPAVESTTTNVSAAAVAASTGKTTEEVSNTLQNNMKAVDVVEKLPADLPPLGGMAPSATGQTSTGGVGGGTAAPVSSALGTVPGAAPSVGPSGGTGGGTAAAVSSSAGTGASVASASMAATAPESPAVGQTPGAQPANHMNKPKAQPDPVNNIASVPEVWPVLGSLADLWYHDASSLNLV